MNNLPEETVNKIMEDEALVESVGNMVANMDTENLGALRERAEQLLQTDEGKKMLQSLQKKGLTRKKMKKQLKEAKKNKPVDDTKKEMIDCVLINESRKVRLIKINSLDVLDECKKKLKFNEPDQNQCSNLSIGPFINKRLKFWIDSSKNCEKNGNKKIKRLTGINNNGSILFLIDNEDIDLNEFLKVEAMMTEIMKE